MTLQHQQNSIPQLPHLKCAQPPFRMIRFPQLAAGHIFVVRAMTSRVSSSLSRRLRISSRRLRNPAMRVRRSTSRWPPFPSPHAGAAASAERTFFRREVYLIGYMKLAPEPTFSSRQLTGGKACLRPGIPGVLTKLASCSPDQDTPDPQLHHCRYLSRMSSSGSVADVPVVVARWCRRIEPAWLEFHILVADDARH